MSARRPTFLFDLDDTLVATGEASWVACTDLVNAFLQANGILTAYSSAYLTQHGAGTPLDIFVRKLAREHNVEIGDAEMEKLHQQAEPIVLDYFRTRLAPIDAVRESIEQLIRSRCAVAVVTSSSREWVEECLEAAALSDLIRSDCIFSARSMGLAPKPAPAVYKEAIAHFPIDNSFVAVEDSPPGVKSAMGAGVDFVIGCVAFSSPESRTSQANALRELGANSIFDNWGKFITAVEEALTEQPTHAPRTYPHTVPKNPALNQ